MTTKKHLKNPVPSALRARKPVPVIDEQISPHRMPPFVTFMASVGDPDISVSKPIPVTMEPDEGSGIIASFMDAGIASGGETVQDAFECLQSMISSTFKTVSSLPDTKLGPRMRRTRLVLMEFLCPRSPKKTHKRSQGS